MLRRQGGYNEACQKDSVVTIKSVKKTGMAVRYVKGIE